MNVPLAATNGTNYMVITANWANVSKVMFSNDVFDLSMTDITLNVPVAVPGPIAGAELRPDLGERWPSRLVATAEEERLNIRRIADRRPLIPVRAVLRRAAHFQLWAVMAGSPSPGPSHSLRGPLGSCCTPVFADELLGGANEAASGIATRIHGAGRRADNDAGVLAGHDLRITGDQATRGCLRGYQRSRKERGWLDLPRHWYLPLHCLCNSSAIAAKTVETSNAASRIESCRTYLIEASLCAGQAPNLDTKIEHCKSIARARAGYARRLIAAGAFQLLRTAFQLPAFQLP